MFIFWRWFEDCVKSEGIAAVQTRPFLLPKKKEALSVEKAEVIVVGGGATGVGILRDLSMRGVNALLIEKRDLANGASSRFHGLLHCGGRYAVKDQEAAKECIVEIPSSFSSLISAFITLKYKSIASVLDPK